MADYRSMTNEEFSDILGDIIHDEGIKKILAIGDVYSILAEEYNNAVLNEWARRNPEKAHTNGEDEEE
jgi:hypothetical protein